MTNAASARALMALSLWMAGWPAAQAQTPQSTASVQRGQALFESRCVGCHSLDEHRVGPALGTVVGRRAGQQAGFTYSAALAGSRHTWTPDKLQTWLTDPEALVPGQAMGYRLTEAADRRDVVAYLQSLATPSSSPR